MPKATKKKAEKAADFKKAKLKLGKGKKAANNATDTSFKARSIALPSQKPLARALQTAPDDEASPSTSAVPTTAAGLTLDDVLVQVRHVNAGVRKEALRYLKEVLVAGVNRGVKLGERHGEIAKVMRSLGALISDDDTQVRKGLHEFLGWYLPRLPRLALQPYLPLLQLQISSALSHIFPAVRIDACKLVELLLETHAEDVVADWPAKATEEGAAASAVPSSGSIIFDGLRLSAGLGEEKGASTQGGFKLSSANKLVILRTITTFISRALDSTEYSDMTGTMQPTVKLGEWTLSDINALPADQWSLLTHDEWGIVEGGKKAIRTDLSAGDGVMEELSKTYLALHSLLLSTFMESAPSAFPPSSAASSTSADDVSMNLCSICVELVWVFARTFFNSETFDTLDTAAELRASFSDFVKRMTAWFPFNRPSQAASDSGGTLFNLSLNYSKLAAALAPKAPSIVLQKRRDGWRHRVRAIDAAWAGLKNNSSSSKAASNQVAFRLASEWIEECLEPSTDALAPAISQQAYADLLPVIATLAQRPGSILESFLPAVLRQPSTSGKRRASDAFLVSLLWAHEDRFSTLPFFVPTSSTARAGFTSWIASVPRTLWELGARDSEASDALLRFLLDLGMRDNAFEKPFSLIDPDAAFGPAGLASKLVPFFHFMHPTKGPIEGPWTKLPQKTQRLGLDVARVWVAMDARLGTAVATAVRGTWGETYWTSI